jgi:hypothetical protein
MENNFKPKGRPKKFVEIASTKDETSIIEEKENTTNNQEVDINVITEELEKKFIEREERLKKEFDERLVEISKNSFTQQPILQAELNQKPPFGERIQSMDDEDYLPNEVIYTTYGTGFTMSSYFKNGVEKRCPYNAPITFEYASSDRRTSGEEDKLIHYCTFKTRSKAMCKWIEESPYYGTTILKDAMNTKARFEDIAIISKYNRIKGQTYSLKRDKLFIAAKSNGIILGNKSEHEIQEELATILLNRELEADKKNEAIRLKETLAKDLVEHKT